MDWFLYDNSLRHETVKIQLTHFMQLVFFYTPWKQHKTSSFLMLWRGIEIDQWYKMG